MYLLLTVLMVYKISKEDIMKLCENEELVSIDIKKLRTDDFLITLKGDSGIIKKFITKNLENLENLY
jgi:hypothetical protein